jgi:formylglycine-generating enzyme required for sulfatase activity
MMGSSQDDPEREANEQRVQAIITKGFWLAKHKCSVRHVGVTIEEERARPDKRNYNPFRISQGDFDKQPWQGTWEDWKQWLAKQKSPAEGWHFDIPTEAQWEHACRAGTSSISPRYLVAGRLSRELDVVMQAGRYPDMLPMALAANGRPNSWGLYEMLSDYPSRLLEFCRDFYAQQLPGGSDPLVTEGKLHVVKGLGPRPAFRAQASFGCLRLALVPDGL